MITQLQLINIIIILLTLTQDSLLHFDYNNGDANAAQCYVMHSLPTKFGTRICICHEHFTHAFFICTSKCSLFVIFFLNRKRNISIFGKKKLSNIRFYGNLFGCPRSYFVRRCTQTDVANKMDAFLLLFLAELSWWQNWHTIELGWPTFLMERTQIVYKVGTWKNKIWSRRLL